MQKLFTITLMLVLIVGLGLMAPAQEIGLEQAWNGSTNLRLDADYALFSIPLTDKVTYFETGLKVPTTLADSYLVAKINFAKYDTSWNDDWEWAFHDFKAGVGYPLKLGNWTIRGEFVALTPEWSNVKEWTFEPTLTFGFNFNLFDNTAVE